MKPKLRGEAYHVRYADDFLIMFQHEADAERVMNALAYRPGKFSLEVAVEKTRILPFGRWKGTKERFDFLGFTFYNTMTRTGRYRVSDDRQEEAQSQETSSQGMAEDKVDNACGGYNAESGVGNQGTLQFLWGEWKLQLDTEVLERPQVCYLQNAEQKGPERTIQI